MTNGSHFDVGVIYLPVEEEEVGRPQNLICQGRWGEITITRPGFTKPSLPA
jgi:hypothetical protein